INGLHWEALKRCYNSFGPDLPWVTAAGISSRLAQAHTMPINWSPFVDLIRAHQRFLITTHVRPDPDGLGSQLALADVLEGMGRQVQMVIASAWPPRYTFLDPERHIQRYEAPGNEYRGVEVI